MDFFLPSGVQPQIATTESSVSPGRPALPYRDVRLVGAPQMALARTFTGVTTARHRNFFHLRNALQSAISRLQRVPQQEHIEPVFTIAQRQTALQREHILTNKDRLWLLASRTNPSLGYRNERATENAQSLRARAWARVRCATKLSRSFYHRLGFYVNSLTKHLFSRELGIRPQFCNFVTVACELRLYPLNFAKHRVFSIQYPAYEIVYVLGGHFHLRRYCVVCRESGGYHRMYPKYCQSAPFF